MFDTNKKVQEYYYKLKQDAENKSAYFVKVAEQSPEYVKYSALIRELQIKKARLEYQGGDTRSIGEQISKARLMLNYALENIGLTAELLQPDYQCKLCSDTGMLESSACVCMKGVYSRFLSEQLNNGTARLHSFEDAVLDDKNMSAFSTMKNMCKKFPNNVNRTIIFSGKTGTGKTFLAECVANELLNSDFSVLFISSFNLINSIKEYHFSFTKNLGQLLNRLYDCDMLIIDDLGSEAFIKNITEEYLVSILNERLRAGKHTMFTTNLNINEILSTYGERFHARVSEKKTSVLFVFDSFNNMRKIV